MIQAKSEITKLRVFAGFAIAPLVPGILWAIFLVMIHPSTDDFGGGIFMITLSMIMGYPVALLLGIPIYFLMKRLGWVKIYHYLFAGAIFGMASVFLIFADKLQYFSFSEFLHYYMTPYDLFRGSIAGMIATGAFWVITRPDLLLARTSKSEKLV